MKAQYGSAGEEQPAEAGVAELCLTASQRQRVDQIGRELAALLELPDVPRIHRTAQEMLQVLVQGGMAVDRAIDVLAISLVLTQQKMFGKPSDRH